ncbi:unnamed protein product [Tenebrio molitor]|nr:unnamed protein product [Tenebrio molitor]
MGLYRAFINDSCHKNAVSPFYMKLQPSDAFIYSEGVCLFLSYP